MSKQNITCTTNSVNTLEVRHINEEGGGFKGVGISGNKVKEWKQGY